MYFVIRVTSSQEKITSDILENKIAKSNVGVYSILVLEGMRGYLVLEAENELACRELISNEPHVKGMLGSALSEAELYRMLETKQTAQMIEVGDIVEFTAGPFKGYKAKVIKSDSTKDEITVELMDVAVPIPVTTKAGTARVVEKAEKV